MAERMLEVHVTGRVQGVWYRAWACETADELGLTGWVRNERVGSVRAVIAGPEDAVARMLAAMRRGPEAAEVAGLETWPADEELPDRFEIRR